MKTGKDAYEKKPTETNRLFCTDSGRNHQRIWNYILYFVVNRFQISKVRDIVREYDKAAYVTIVDVADVL